MHTVILLFRINIHIQRKLRGPEDLVEFRNLSERGTPYEEKLFDAGIATKVIVVRSYIFSLKIFH